MGASLAEVTPMGASLAEGTPMGASLAEGTPTGASLAEVAPMGASLLRSGVRPSPGRRLPPTATSPARGQRCGSSPSCRPYARPAVFTRRRAKRVTRWSANNDQLPSSSGVNTQNSGSRSMRKRELVHRVLAALDRHVCRVRDHVPQVAQGLHHVGEVGEVARHVHAAIVDAEQQLLDEADRGGRPQPAPGHCVAMDVGDQAVHGPGADRFVMGTPARGHVVHDHPSPHPAVKRAGVGRVRQPRRAPLVLPGTVESHDSRVSVSCTAM